MPNLKCFTTREVARLCRVSDATVKRWEDAGFLKSERTNGGHRRFRAEEVARFQRENNLGLKLSHGDDSIIKMNLLRQNGKFPTDLPLFPALLCGSEAEAANLLIGEYLHEKSPAEIFDDLICPAMREIGELWTNGDLTVAQEHLATRTATNAVHKLRSALPVPMTSEASAMCCAIEGDFHELPPLLAQIILENEGWEVINFGAHTPLGCLSKEILKHQPEVICIAAAFIENFAIFTENFNTFIKNIEKTGTPVICGGRAFSDLAGYRIFPDAIFMNSFSELENWSRSR